MLSSILAQERTIKDDQNEKVNFRDQDYDEYLDDELMLNEEKEAEEQLRLKKLLAEAINLNTHGQLYFSNGKRIQSFFPPIITFNINL
jgi:hypothetical protein